MNIPADMNDAEAAAKINASAVVSIRDMMLLLGATDEQMRQHDIDSAEAKEILDREPWRRQTNYLTEPDENGMRLCTVHVDWTGTRFEEQQKKLQEMMDRKLREQEEEG